MSDEINLKRIIAFKKTVRYVLIDLIFRIILMVGCSFKLLNPGLVFLVSMVLMPVIWLIIMKINQRGLKLRIPKQYVVNLRSDIIGNDTAKYWILLTIVGVVVTIVTDSFSEYGSLKFHVIFGMTFSMFYLVISSILLTKSSTLADGKILVENTDGEYVSTKLSELFKATLLGTDYDEKTRNTLKIRGLKIALDNNNLFVNRLTNESVFIGALVFSGFVSIITSDKIHDKPNIFGDTLTFMNEKAVLLLDLEFDSFLTALERADELYGIVALLSIYCSILFIVTLLFKGIMQNVVLRSNKILDVAESSVGFNDEADNTLIENSIISVDKSIQNIFVIGSILKLIRFMGYLILLFILCLSGLFFSVTIFKYIIGLIGVIIFIFTSLKLYIDYKQFEIVHTYKY